MPKVHPIVEQITGQGLSKISENNGDSERSGFYKEMLNEFSKYAPFDNISGIEKAETLSQPDCESMEFDNGVL